MKEQGKFTEKELPYFSDYKTHFSPKIWEENGRASYSPNVAYVARWGAGSGGADIFFSYFPPLKPRYILW